MKETYLERLHELSVLFSLPIYKTYLLLKEPFIHVTAVTVNYNKSLLNHSTLIIVFHQKIYSYSVSCIMEIDIQQVNNRVEFFLLLFLF